jgi:hypothetical protein
VGVLGKSKRLKGKRKRVGAGVCAELSARLTASFQRELRQSELWDQMVAEFGEQRAEEILRECTAEVQAGFTTHEPGDRPTDLS